MLSEANSFNILTRSQVEGLTLLNCDTTQMQCMDQLNPLRMAARILKEKRMLPLAYMIGEIPYGKL